jgi:hypothetical protein
MDTWTQDNVLMPCSQYYVSVSYDQSRLLLSSICIVKGKQTTHVE